MPSRSSIPTLVSERVLNFVNSLSVSGDPLKGMVAFRDGLLGLLEDVDRISIGVNFSCDLQDPEGYQPQMSIAQHITASGSLEGEVEGGGAMLQTTEGTPVERLVEDLRSKGFPVEDYFPPDGFAFYLGGAAYLGTVILWRLRSNPPISRETLELIERLEPFLVFLLSDLVARRQRADPDVMKFSDALHQLASEVGLSRGEQRVVILQLFGHSYKDIADVLGVSVDGVKHHLKMIHRKTGTRSSTELFAKYFMPRLELRDGGPDTENGAVDEPDDEIDDLRIPPFTEAGQETPYRFDGIDTLGERLRCFGILTYGSVQGFARALKMAPSNLQKYLGGEREPGPATLARLLALGCNLNGLFSGRGEVFADNAAGNELRMRRALAVRR